MLNHALHRAHARRRNHKQRILEVSRKLDELEILVAPIGIVPVMTFLKNHHNAQFGCLVDIAGVDVPTKEYRLGFFGALMVLK